MLSIIEYHFIKKDYQELINKNNYICYVKKNKLIDQITIENKNNEYHLSFPMRNSNFNYKTTFKTLNKLNDYVKNYI